MESGCFGRGRKKQMSIDIMPYNMTTTKPCTMTKSILQDKGDEIIGEIITTTPDHNTEGEDSNDMTDKLEFAYFVLTGTMSSLSLIGCAIIILCFIYFKDHQHRGRHILLCLSIADMLTAIGK